MLKAKSRDDIALNVQTTEPLQVNVERLETPPFYRLTRRPVQPVTVASCEADSTTSQRHADDLDTAATTTTQLLDKRHIHTKRHSAEDPAKLQSASDLSVLLSVRLCVCLCVCVYVCLYCCYSQWLLWFSMQDYVCSV